jgi:hypothetical protein
MAFMGQIATWPGERKACGKTAYLRITFSEGVSASM